MEINAALAWLAGVVRTPQGALAPLPESSTAFRAFAPTEHAKLDADCRGFLLLLERSGILSPACREDIIERALASAGAALSLNQIQLIVLMVLWSQKAPASQLVAEELLSARGERLPN
jgi:Smg protein